MNLGTIINYKPSCDVFAKVRIHKRSDEKPIPSIVEAIANVEERFEAFDQMRILVEHVFQFCEDGWRA